MARVAARYCEPTHRQDVADYFTERMARVPGGIRKLAQVLESMTQCVAYKDAQATSIESFLASPIREQKTDVLNTPGDGAPHLGQATPACRMIEVCQGAVA